MATIKYYSITCSRGHCGRGRSSEITFAFEAVNLLAAMDMARHMPSVKHSRGILAGKEISQTEYYEYRSISAYERRPQGNWGR